MQWLTKTTYTDHTVIYGTSDSHIAMIIKQMHEEHTSSRFVVIMEEDTMPRRFIWMKDDGVHIHFVSGNPSDEQTLEYARVDRAKSCILLRETKVDSDMYLLSYVMSIRALSAQARVIVEIVDESNKRLFEQARTDAIINTDSITQNMLVRSVTDDVHHMMRELLTFWAWYELYRVPLDEKRFNRPFGELIHHYIDEDIHIIWVYQAWEVKFASETLLQYGDRIYTIAKDRKEIV